MQTSDRGIDLIKRHEELRQHAYPDPATGGEPWTIGYGHTGGVRRGDTCDVERAEYWLRQDLGEAERAVHDFVVVPLSQNQFDALVDFVFNVGVGHFGNSTLLHKLNASDYQGAADEFLRWNKAGGHVMAGLVHRREDEQRLFLTL
jgi:lysozyme